MSKYSSIPGASRFGKSTLDKVYRRGLGAYYSSGSRPKLQLMLGQWDAFDLLLRAKVELEKRTKIC